MIQVKTVISIKRVNDSYLPGTYFNIHIPFSVSHTILSGLLFAMFLSLCTCWFHNLDSLSSLLHSTYFVAFYTGCLSVILPHFPPMCEIVVKSQSIFSHNVKFYCKEVNAYNMCCTVSSKSCLSSVFVFGSVCNICVSRYFVCNS